MAFLIVQCNENSLKCFIMVLFYNLNRLQSVELHWFFVKRLARRCSNVHNPYEIILVFVLLPRKGNFLLSWNFYFLAPNLSFDKFLNYHVDHALILWSNFIVKYLICFTFLSSIKQIGFSYIPNLCRKMTRWTCISRMKWT